MSLKGSVLRGVVFGILLSVVWLDLLPVFVVVLAVALATVAGRAWRARNPRLFVPLGVSVATAVAIGLVALALPFKWLDRNHLDAVAPGGCMSVGELATALGTSDAFVREDVRNRQVCFQSAHPSMREVASALEAQAGVTPKWGWCGTGTTLLFGMHPIGAAPFALRAAR